MEFEADRFVCGMIRRLGHYMGLPDWGDVHMGALFAEALRAGKGCDVDDLESVREGSSMERQRC